MSANAPIGPDALYIVHYPHPALREKAREVEDITPEVRAVAQRMLELMRHAEGIGLAAPQIALPWRLFVCHVPVSEDNPLDSDPPCASAEPLVCINPELTDFSSELEPYDEGCLSLPDITGAVRRPHEVTLTATNLEGNRFTLRAGGLLARCIQHEHDHLNAVLIIDKMQQLSRMKNRRAIKDLEAQASAR